MPPCHARCRPATPAGDSAPTRNFLLARGRFPRNRIGVGGRDLLSHRHDRPIPRSRPPICTRNTRSGSSAEPDCPKCRARTPRSIEMVARHRPRTSECRAAQPRRCARHRTRAGNCGASGAPGSTRSRKAVRRFADRRSCSLSLWHDVVTQPLSSATAVCLRLRAPARSSRHAKPSTTLGFVPGGRRRSGVAAASARRSVDISPWHRRLHPC